MQALQDDTELPKVYDIDVINRYWMQRPLAVLTRAAAIGSRVVPYGTGMVVDYRTGKLEEVGHQQARAVELRELLTVLGPTFIKFGQMLSIRPDLLPPTFVYELQKLCDAVPSFPTAIALQTISSELGRPIEQMFSDLTLESEPIAAASLGQVFQCHMVHDGRCVAVKVQRPDMIEQVSLDLFLLRRYMCFVEYVKRNLTWLGVVNQPRPYDVALLDTFARASYLELDYNHEVRCLRVPALLAGFCFRKCENYLRKVPPVDAHVLPSSRRLCLRASLTEPDSCAGKLTIPLGNNVRRVSLSCASE